MMKKFLILTCLLISTNIANATNWYDIGQGRFIDLESIKEKGNYIYFKEKDTNLNSLNEFLKNMQSGIIIDNSYVSYITFTYKYDCKIPRYKVELKMLYGKNGEVLRKYSNNTWYYDLTKDSWANVCSIKYYLK